MGKAIEIIYADDKEQYRKMILEELLAYNIECIAEAGNGRELLRILRFKSPQVVLLDLEMPVMDGNEAMAQILVDFPATRVLVISLHYETELVEDYLNRGAMGYIAKDTICGDISILADAIKCINSGEIYVYPSLLAQRTFTNRQIEMIPLICDELTNKKIAEKLGIGERGVERLRQKIYERSNTTGATSFLKFAFKRGLDLLGRNVKMKK